MEIVKIIGVYHADGGIVGELSYVAGKMLGRRHCALCDITHSFAWKKDEWQKCEVGFGVPFQLLHLNERTDTIKKFTEGKTPCVIGEYADGRLVMLLNAETLSGFGGDVGKFEGYLRKTLSEESYI